MVQFNDWCDSADTPVGNHHVRVITSRPVDVPTGIQLTAATVPGHYATTRRKSAWPVHWRAWGRSKLPEW